MCKQLNGWGVGEGLRAVAMFDEKLAKILDERQITSGAQKPGVARPCAR